MSDKDTKFYLASGEDEKTVRQFFKERLAAYEAIDDFAKSHNGVAVGNGSRCLGLTFPDSPPPKGWLRKGEVNDKPYFAPSKRSKQMKALLAEMGNVEIPCASDLHSRLTTEGPAFCDDGGRSKIVWITAEVTASDKAIIHVHKQSEYEPTSSKFLKTSEYWAIKENSGAEQ